MSDPREDALREAEQADAVEPGQVRDDADPEVREAEREE
jgi:hypothetical protein